MKILFCFKFKVLKRQSILKMQLYYDIDNRFRLLIQNFHCYLPFQNNHLNIYKKGITLSTNENYTVKMQSW